MFRNSIHIALLLSLLVLSSCSIKPFLTEDDQMVAKNSVKIIQEEKDEYKEPITEGQIKPILRPRANGKFLGTYLPQYIFLSLQAKKMERQDTSKFRDFLQKQFGQKPRLVDSVLMGRSITNIENYLFNNGYFNGTADYEVVQKNDISSIIRYSVYPRDQHVFGKSAFEFKDSTIQEDILEGIKLKDYIKQGEAFSVNDFNDLRNEMVKNGLEKGYYFFDKNSIYIEPDTLSQKGVADIYVVVENERDSLYNKQFYIRNIYMQMGKGRADTYDAPEEFNKKLFSQAKLSRVKPKVLNRFILMEQGELYSRTKHLNTINKLYDLPLVRYANIDFQLADIDSLTNPKTDSLFLDVFIDANTHRLMNFTFEPTISQFQGPAIGAEIGLEHRNVFGGGELFDFGISGRLESVNNRENENLLFGTQVFEIEPKVVFPRLLGIENVVNDVYERTINQRTTVGLRYGFQNYVDLYKLETYGISQVWEWQSSPHNKHTLAPIDISRINLEPTEYYREIINDLPSLRYSLDSRMILGSNYTYYYTNRLKKEENKAYFNFTGTVDLSGNLAYLLTGKDYLKIGKDTVSQFVRTLGSFTYHQPISHQYGVEWVNHLAGGLAYSTNSNLPYIPAVKQFFLGGSSSMRAWKPRALGPGTYEDPNVGSTNKNVDQRGDILMEFNSELRYPVTKVFGMPLNGALFTDVGNIWANNELPIDEGGRPGAEFSSNFYKQFAVVAGTGLRLDIQNFLIIRGDFAWRLRDPALPDGNRWVDNPITWKKMQPQLGIGYPFDN